METTARMASMLMDNHEMWLVAVVSSYSVVPALMNRKEGGATPADIICYNTAVAGVTIVTYHRGNEEREDRNTNDW